RLCRRWPLGAAARDGRPRPSARAHARARLDGRESQTQGVRFMSSPLRFGPAVSAIALATMIAGCAAPQQKTGFGGKVDENVGLATRALMALSEHQVPAAIDFAERAVEHSPDDAGFRGVLGNAYFAAGRFESAEAAYTDS